MVLFVSTLVIVSVSLAFAEASVFDLVCSDLIAHSWYSITQKPMMSDPLDPARVPVTCVAEVSLTLAKLDVLATVVVMVDQPKLSAPGFRNR